MSSPNERSCTALHETVDTGFRQEDYGGLMSLPFAYSVRRWLGVLVAKCGQGVATRDR